jgi:hypothetical protein
VGDAEEAFENALRLRPNYVNAWKNRGTLRMWEGNIDGALDAYAEAMKLNPQEPELHRNLGVIYLLRGEFARGWEEYRWRWQTPGFVRSVSRPHGEPTPLATSNDPTIWDGSDPAGKRIILYAEQGLGDMLHFVRMAGELKSRGAFVIVESPLALTATLQRVPGIDQLIPKGMELPECDYHCSVIDAADRLRAGISGIPANIPYLFAAEHLVAYWRRWLQSLPGKFRIGICWQGNRDHQADHVRSIPLRAFEPLAWLPNVTLISLQKGFGSEQLERVEFGSQIIRLPPGTDESGGPFQDTAAIMTSLDLIVTSDTSLAHLAGGLGQAVWVPLATIPDWRWLLQGERTAWYPTMRLFRQTVAGDWDSVLKDVAKEVSRLT